MDEARLIEMSASPVLRALRGATTLDSDSRAEMIERVTELLAALFERNDVGHDDLVSIIFTATDDLHSMFPAEAARTLGISDVPLMCARELDIDGATTMCVRIMVHAYSTRPRAEIEHVYLRRATALRPDIAKK